MRFPQQYVQQAGYPKVALAISGAAPQTVVGSALDSGNVGSALFATATIAITTLNLTVALKWQVNVAGGWADVFDSLNTTVAATGTGTLATTTVVLPAGRAVLSGSRQVRIAAVSGGASGGGAGVDSVSFSYDFRQPSTSLGV